MRLPLVFVLLFTLAIADELTQTTASSDSTIELNKLCLNINTLTINGVQFSSKQMKWTQTEGIFYVYNPLDSMDTFKSMKFPILPQTNKKKTKDSNDTTDTTDTTNPPDLELPITFTFTGDEASVGCWIEPNFDQLNLRFKLYEFYHIALKAVSMIQIPAATADTTQTESVTLNTLPYQYKNANVMVDITLQWQTLNVKSVPPIHPAGPPIIPVTPPIGQYDNIANIPSLDTFDSDDFTDNIMVENKENNGIIPAANTVNNNTSTDWMYVAALCSSMLGLFILIYICLWAYKTYGRAEYESIKSGNITSKVSGKLGGIRKISLRNHANEEKKSIMHPNASYNSYTFDD